MNAAMFSPWPPPSRLDIAARDERRRLLNELFNSKPEAALSNFAYACGSPLKKTPARRDMKTGRLRRLQDQSIKTRASCAVLDKKLRQRLPSFPQQAGGFFDADAGVRDAHAVLQF